MHPPAHVPTSTAQQAPQRNLAQPLDIEGHVQALPERKPELSPELAFALLFLICHKVEVMSK